MSQNDPLNACTLNTHESKVHQYKQVTNMRTKLYITKGYQRQKLTV